jgi:two-component system KDP operon response regulator KdpE
LNRTRILVIDDEPQIHRFLHPALEASGYAVERADTAADGLARVRARPPWFCWISACRTWTARTR